MFNFGSVKKAVWYEGSFPGSELVTNTNSNPALGITNIVLTPPNAGQDTAGVLANVDITMGYIAFRGSIWAQKEGTGLRFNPEQRKTTDANGETKYYDVVRVQQPVVAQILRYAESQRAQAPVIVNTKAPVAPAPTAGVPAGLTPEMLAMIQQMMSAQMPQASAPAQVVPTPVATAPTPAPLNVGDVDLSMFEG